MGIDKWCSRYTTTSIRSSMKSALAFLCLAALLAPSRASAITCQICVDIVTDIDNFITSETTEDDILAFFNQICEAVDQLLPGLGQTCTDFLNNNGPGIIESIVNENLNPTEVCTKLTLCP